MSYLQKLRDAGYEPCFRVVDEMYEEIGHIAVCGEENGARWGTALAVPRIPGQWVECFAQKPDGEVFAVKTHVEAGVLRRDRDGRYVGPALKKAAEFCFRCICERVGLPCE